MKRKPLIFFDGNCSFCKRAVRRIILSDKKSKFQFAPLCGKTAERTLKGTLAYLKTSNTLVLIERKSHHRITTKKRASALLRILWILGGFYRCSVIFYPLLFLLNPLYRVFARYRRWFFQGKIKSFSGYQDRFLP